MAEKNKVSHLSERLALVRWVQFSHISSKMIPFCWYSFVVVLKDNMTESLESCKSKLIFLWKTLIELCF